MNKIGKLCSTLICCCFLFCAIAFGQQATNTASKIVFLENRAARLYLGNEEFKEIGFNFYHAFRLYLDLGWDYESGAGREFARRDLEALASRGFRVIRVMGPFDPGEFYEVFYDEDPLVQENKRRIFFNALVAFLTDCDKLNIWVVFSLMWNMQSLADLGHHSLHEAFTNPQSLGYRRFEEYVQAVVQRCLGRPKIIWEIGNEYNLAVDLRALPYWAERGTIADSSAGIGQVYRGPDNNFNSYELADFFRRVIALIKSIDSRHLVVTGNAEPPMNAMQRLQAALSGRAINDKKDTLIEHGFSLALLNRDADLISSHLYIKQGIGADFYQKFSRSLGKPLFMGEVGPNFKRAGDKIINADYTDPKVIKDMERKFKDIIKNGVSISLVWTYNCVSKGDLAFNACYGQTDEFLKKAEIANRELKKRR